MPVSSTAHPARITQINRRSIETESRSTPSFHPSRLSDVHAFGPVVAHAGVYVCRGWRGYFEFCQTPSVLGELEAWIRRRLRYIGLKHWRTGRRRVAELMKRKVNRDLAVGTVATRHGPWRLSRSVAMSIALPNKFWDWLGVERVQRVKRVFSPLHLNGYLAGPRLPFSPLSMTSNPPGASSRFGRVSRETTTSTMNPSGIVRMPGWLKGAIAWVGGSL